MPASNPTASNASQPPTQDLQQLVGLLGNLMPLLLRLQSQAFPQEAYPSQAFDPSLQRGAGFATPNPALDRQASENSSVTSSPNSCARSPPISKPTPGNMPASRTAFRSSRRPRTGSWRATTLKPST